jgi:hypothetical protein
LIPEEGTPGPGPMDYEDFPLFTQTPEISQANSAFSKSPPIRSELSLAPKKSSFSGISEVKVAKKKRIRFRKGFTKYVHHIRMRKRLQKWKSIDFEKVICMVCKRNVKDIAEGQNAEVSNDNSETKGEGDSPENSSEETALISTLRSNSLDNISATLENEPASDIIVSENSRGEAPSADTIKRTLSIIINNQKAANEYPRRYIHSGIMTPTCAALGSNYSRSVSHTNAKPLISNSNTSTDMKISKAQTSEKKTFSRYQPRKPKQPRIKISV